MTKPMNKIEKLIAELCPEGGGDDEDIEASE